MKVGPLAVLLLCACGGSAAPAQKTQPEQQLAQAAHPKADVIRVRTPESGAFVQSPLRVTGEARGIWFFEATFPVALLDADGRLLVQTYAQAKGEWMTESFVPFESELRFAKPTTATGTLLLERDNPSGLPEHADELRLPVKFIP